MYKFNQKYVMAAVLTVVTVLVIRYLRESYRSQGFDWAVGSVDNNPTRRTSQFFDNCSPENMEDCKRNNPYEGLPLP